MLAKRTEVHVGVRTERCEEVMDKMTMTQRELNGQERRE